VLGGKPVFFKLAAGKPDPGARGNNSGRGTHERKGFTEIKQTIEPYPQRWPDSKGQRSKWQKKTETPKPMPKLLRYRKKARKREGKKLEKDGDEKTKRRKKKSASN